MIKNGDVKGYNIDFPEVIEIREKLLGKREAEESISSDLKDLSWFDKIEFNETEGMVAFASGVFYYFKKEEVKILIEKMAEKFPGGMLVFDATNSRGLKKMLKTWGKGMELSKVSTYFSLENEQEIMTWSDKIESVEKKPYMTGYRALDSRYGFIPNKLFKYLDSHNLCQIIEIRFKASS